LPSGNPGESGSRQKPQHVIQQGATTFEIVWHDVPNLERAGAPRSTTMAMVGHKTEGIYRRYAIRRRGDAARGAAKRAAYSEGTIPGKVRGRPKPPPHDLPY